MIPEEERASLADALEINTQHNARLLAMLTAFQGGLFDEASAIIDEALEEGHASVKTLIVSLAASTVGMVEGLCYLTGVDAESWFQSMAQQNAHLSLLVDELRQSGSPEENG